MLKLSPDGAITLTVISITLTSEEPQGYGFKAVAIVQANGRARPEVVECKLGTWHIRLDALVNEIANQYIHQERLAQDGSGFAAPAAPDDPPPS
jgi:hypothetical protein